MHRKLLLFVFIISSAVRIIASQMSNDNLKCWADTYMTCSVECAIHGKGAYQLTDPCGAHSMITNGTKNQECYECCKQKHAESRYHDEIIASQKKRCWADTYMTCSAKCTIHDRPMWCSFCDH